MLVLENELQPSNHPVIIAYLCYQILLSPVQSVRQSDVRGVGLERDIIVHPNVLRWQVEIVKFLFGLRKKHCAFYANVARLRNKERTMSANWLRLRVKLLFPALCASMRAAFSVHIWRRASSSFECA